MTQPTKTFLTADSLDFALAHITSYYDTDFFPRTETKLLHYGYWDRRSVILAAALLAKDEREKWLAPLLKGDSLGVVEKWMARWVMDGAPADAQPLFEPF